MVWTYPDLGMRIWMGAKNPLAPYHVLEAKGRPLLPFPDSLARHPEWAAIGAAVFPRLAAGTHALPLRSALARFEGEERRRLLAHVECAGSATDSLKVEWAVHDTLHQERARGTRVMGASACAAVEYRAASFTADLAPGRYRVATFVTDGKGRAGVLGEVISIAPPAAGLSLSDVVVTCGVPQSGFSRGQALRLEPDPRRRVSADAPLTAYFEVYHLGTGADGWARFEHAYRVRSLGRDRRLWIERALAPRRQPPSIEASREEDTPGSIRRQYITVPVRALPPGEYEIEIEVRDLISGATATGRARFFRDS
jgi:hypothetical protein